MLTIAETRERVSMVVPVHFQPSVPAHLIAAILERTFTEHRLFCEFERTVVVVDRGSPAEEVLRQAAPGSPLRGLRLHVLDRNLGKTGAIRAGLARLLSEAATPFLVTRDCDGDNVLEDLPRLATLASQICSGVGLDKVAVFGARPSLMKPMGWIREQWERLVNNVFTDVVDYLLARQGRVLDRRHWNGYPLDLQGGYRLYTRAAAEIAVESLTNLPEDPEVYLLACETLPFPALALRGGVLGQVQVMTRVEQPVSSYSHLSFARCYGGLLDFLGKRYQVSAETLVALMDNHLLNAPAWFSGSRQDFLECRSRLAPQAPPPVGPSLL